jgi:hypothetical protein
MSLKMTVLEMVQSTLGAMDSDAVDTLGETIESEQVALVCKEVYQQIAVHLNVPQFKKLTQLNGLSDLSRATVMRLPNEFTDIAEIRYRRKLEDGSGRFRMDKIFYVEPDEFLERQLELDTTEAVVGENVLEGNVRVPYYNDRAPP